MSCPAFHSPERSRRYDDEIPNGYLYNIIIYYTNENKFTNLGVDSEICYFPPQEATLNHGHEGNDTEYSKMMYQRLFEFLSKYIVSQ